MIDWFPTSAGEAPPDDARRPGRRRDALDLHRLARRLDAHDAGRPGRADRVASLAAELAGDLGWPGARIQSLREAALVHDVGRACVPAEHLTTVRPLLSSERAALRDHAAAGAGIAAAVLGPGPVAWIRHHHERWDGAGYPDGLAGDAVPHGALLIGLADAYDEMCTGPWDRALSPGDALARCADERGRRFAPWAVDALGRVVAKRFATASAPRLAPN